MPDQSFTSKRTDQPIGLMALISGARLLDPKLHVTVPSEGYADNELTINLLGDNSYCPLIRRTDALNHAMASGFDLEAKSLVES